MYQCHRDVTTHLETLKHCSVRFGLNSKCSNGFYTSRVLRFVFFLLRCFYFLRLSYTQMKSLRSQISFLYHITICELKKVGESSDGDNDRRGNRDVRDARDDRGGRDERSERIPWRGSGKAYVLEQVSNARFELELEPKLELSLGMGLP